MTLLALTGARIFTGETMLDGHAVVIEGERIAALVPQGEVSATIAQQHLAGGTLAPGFIDLQVNGGGGALFNAAPDLATVHTIARAHRRFGTTGLLPTLITDTPAVMAAGLAAIRAALAAKVPGVLGVHLEGPFLDAERSGAHMRDFIRAAQPADILSLSRGFPGSLLLTLSPRQVSLADIARLARAGVVVSLGHSDAKAELVSAALAAGASGFTHVFNAMSEFHHRAPGMVGLALTDAQSYCGLICDGVHVDPIALRLALASKNPDRLVLVSDAMPPAAGGPDSFYLQGRLVQRHGGRLVLDDGTLAGCDLTMDAALRYCVHTLLVPLNQALRMASLNAAAWIKRDHEFGRIAPGFVASLVHLDENLHPTQSWIAGQNHE